MSIIKWSLSVVVVGIAINLASAYLKPFIDSIFSKWSRHWATRTEAERAARAARIAHLKEDPIARLSASVSIVHQDVKAVMSLLFFMALTGLALYGRSKSAVLHLNDLEVAGLLLLSLGAVIIGIGRTQAAARTREELNEAKQD